MQDSQAELPWDRVLVDIKDYVFHYTVDDTKAYGDARTALLDSIGCAIESVSRSAELRSMLGPIVPDTVTPEGFKMPGTSYQLDPLKGSFDLGTAIRFMDHNDCIGGKDWGHPSDNLGAILAVADWLCRSSKSGRVKHNGPPLTMHTILTAMIKAYEIQGCFLTYNAFNAHGLDHVILVKLASTAVVSWLMGLSEDQTMAAISHVWMDGGALRTYRSGSNTIPRKGWAAGDACMRAVHFVLLTHRGQAGSRSPLTMPRWGFYDSVFDKRPFDLPQGYGCWAVQHLFFKVMAVEGHSISAVESMLKQYQRLRERRLDPDKHIAKIEVRTNGAANMIINKPGKLSNAADRDHCMQYALAVSVLKGEIPAPEDYLDSSPYATSPVVESLRSRMRIYEDPQFTKDYLSLEKKSIPTGITISLTNGETLPEVLVEYPVGHGKRPETLSRIRDKFTRNMRLMFSDSEIHTIKSAVEDRGDMPISDFLDLLVRAPQEQPKL